MVLRLQALWLLSVAPFAVRSRRRQWFLTPALAATPAGSASAVVAAVHAALRWHPVLFTCLERSAVLHRLLHRYGYPSLLRIGVKSASGPSRIAAHAWVEFPAGTPLLGEMPGEFGVLQPPPSQLDPE